ncbi:MAG: serine/threonine-protein kinase [Acidobacteria bacterium]|nr:serine/threonine-protein kinase [Acidobacteriota bacterium]
MPLRPGTRLGPYEILAPLGAGGMGEVYKAKDTRLDRLVAIKVLPAHLREHPELKARFDREARAISALSHPNICTLHDVGSQEGVDFLVMEHLEGETLASRLAKGALPADQSLRIAVEIAGALERAHRGGVVHRDLKPGNVMLTRAGAKLLDFGLARLLAAETKLASDLSSLATEHKDLTAQGTIMGTFQYMAPEQLEGGEADARSDIFAFGSMLYEMVTGRKAFSGKSQASLIASILSSEPPAITAIQPMTPPALDRVVKRCMAKSPDERWQSAADLASELRWILEGGSSAGIPAPVTARRVRRERLWMGIAAAAGIVAIASVLLAVRARTSVPTPPMRLSLADATGVRHAPFGHVAVSPDGRQLAIIAFSADGKQTQLLVRGIDASGARTLAGTEGATAPFWSPDSRYLGFFANGNLKKVSAAGGPAVVVADAPNGKGGSWNREGVIIFSAKEYEGLSRVSAEGGAVEPATTMDPSEEAHRWPWFLPDGKRFVFLGDAARTEDHYLRLGSLGSLETTRLFRAVTTVAYVPGYLVFVRDRSLLAQPVDPKTLQPAGEPTILGEGIVSSGDNHQLGFSISETGLLVFRSADVDSRLTWLDRAGKAIEDLDEAGQFQDVALSPSGRFAVFGRKTPDGRIADYWSRDLARGVTSRLTFHPGADFSPLWSRDEREIVLSSSRARDGQIFRRAAAEAAGEKMVADFSTTTTPTSWSPDGRTVLLTSGTLETKLDILKLDMSSGATPQPLIRTPFDEYGAVFSPDGRWIAYTSEESGRAEIYLQSYPSPATRLQVTSQGGSYPRWRADGGEVFFVTNTSHESAIEIRQAASGPEAGKAVDLFELRGDSCAPAPDGKRFLCDIRKEDPWMTPMTFVVNWPAIVAAGSAPR